MPDFTQQGSVLTSWMSQHGWAPRSEGSMGRLWAPTSSELDVYVAIPFEFGNDEFAFHNAIEQVARFSEIKTSDLNRAIHQWNVDRTVFVAEVPLAYDYGAPTAELSEISQVFGGAGRIFTAAIDAVNSRLPKTFKTSDVRAGMTEVGSYALPIYVPLSDPHRDDALIAAPAQERAITETVATALSAIKREIIDADNPEPSAEMIRDLQNHGVSADLLTGVSELMSSQENDAETTFQWAGSHAEFAEQQSLPTRVELPHEARDLVKSVARAFKTQLPKHQAFFGKIIGIMYSAGSATADTIMAVPRSNTQEADARNELNGRVRVTHHLDTEDRLAQFYEWNRTGQIVEFGGVTTRVNSDRVIQSPTSFDARPMQTEFDAW
ncbi:hypothetical protein [Corynebacterium qintianiae]|uniref:hypothetical protein n=1 Tax=Corynebacterium qintianiae TaxID=2709392 RepID=UPI0013ED1536|nr:hypothetical protein [Corynebacterium qintianiae]